MPTIDVEVHTRVSQSIRAQQLSGMFDVPAQESHRLAWHIEAPWEARPWNVGLIVGPSGGGKTTVLQHVWGQPQTFDWDAPSVIDAFAPEHPVGDISRACAAVGFNTIPAWLRPYAVLSTGEKFRVNIARLMLDTSPDEPVVIDEFTSVVDRQVAKIGAHAVQKWARKQDRQFVAASCHYDIIDWLQPDWVLDVAERIFTWRSVQPRPSIAVDIRSVDYEVWRLFAPFHYLTATLNKTARCYVAFIDGQPTSFAGVLRRPHPKAKDIMGVSRLVTLPDWQGLGLAFVLVEAIGGAYRVAGQRLRTYPAHPVLVHGFDRSPRWALKQQPGMGRGVFKGPNTQMEEWRHGSRPCAVFEYTGKPWPDRDEALAFLREAHRGGRLMTDVWEKVAHA